MSTTSPKPDYTSEVRFAVVMYGGVSLAIYINGIAQELLRMVRATAPRTGDKSTSVSGTERIYRKVSYLLAEQDEQNCPTGISVSDSVVLDPSRVPPTRFVVDILSGTSAGGINAIFLGKALANGQDIQQLKDLWIQEGDIEKLINDRKSIQPPLLRQNPPASLLNSERMYLELLKAFDGMDKQNGNRPTDAESPFVDELDLFITSTDLQGVVLPIRLSDNLVYERRHRNVMRFVYSSPAMSGEIKTRNDFHEHYNPFLAYAARSTSSFPFAFEPMALSDTDKILNRLTAYRLNENAKSTSTLWQRFYKDYLDPRGVSTVPFPRRAFGDGGYLDNKPFSYATDMLMNRIADVPVDRKLVYIEPSPEHPEDEVEQEKKPDAIENTMAAVVKLPRHETIREDLQRVKDRNRLIERVNSIAAGVDRDSFRVKPTESVQQYESLYDQWEHLGALASPPPTQEWARPARSDEDTAGFDLTDMIKRKGRGYAAYHRLRISTVTDELAEVVARVGGFDENSDYFLIIRNLVRAWRVKTYIEYRYTPDDNRPTLNQFLYEFDLSYSFRRVNYLRKKVDSLYRFDQEARDLIKVKATELAPDAPLRITDGDKPILREEFLRSKAVLNDVFISLRRLARSVRSRRSEQDKKTSAGAIPTSPIATLVTNLITKINERVSTLAPEPGSPTAFLDYFLGAPGSTTYQPGSAEEECEKRAYDFLSENEDLLSMFAKTADGLKSRIAPVKKAAEDDCIALFATDTTQHLSDHPRKSSLMWLARSCLGHYYNNYEDYDLLIYPLLYDTGVGEGDLVDIVRVSPEDAKLLIDERATGCRKLAGSALGHFGAFLQKSWRENDILWGRLDGAERIITSLLPNHPLRVQLIGEAQAEIIHETIQRMDEPERFKLLAEAGMRTKSRNAEPDLVDGFVSRLLKNCEQNQDLQTRLSGLIKTERLRQFYLNSFNVSSKLEPKIALRSAARSTTVVGKILESLSEQRRVNTKYAAWIARLGQIFWALVEVSVPRSFLHLIFRHWLKLLYFLEVLLIVGSTLLLQPDVQRFAITAFGITAAIHLAVVILGDLIESKKRWVNLIKAIGTILLVALIVLGGLTLSTFFGAYSVWEWIVSTRGWFITHPWTLWLSAVAAVIVVFLWSIRDDVRDLIKGTD